MIKRIFDFCVALIALIITLPVMLPVCFLIWRQDGFSPFYVAPRVGRREKIFNMVKLRSMIKNADKSGVDSTSNKDPRITPIGQFVRSTKLDELPQLWNVLIGDMSLVGPRPNVQRETDLYTSEEKKLLAVRPGITDFSSIVFSDEGRILQDSKDPDIDYNQLIRPWKSRLGIFYVEHQTLLVDIMALVLTVIAVLSRDRALKKVQTLLSCLNAPEELIMVSGRQELLRPTAPPGSTEIVTRRS